MVSLVTVPFWAIHSLIFIHAYADKSVTIIEQRKFRDFDGNQNVIGIVINNGKVPVAVLVGLNITNTHSATPSTTTIKEPTFGRTIYPMGVHRLNLVSGLSNPPARHLSLISNKSRRLTTTF
jgi:hypothetical protein